MEMLKKPPIVLALATLFAALAALFAHLHLSQRSRVDAPIEERMPVLIAGQELRAGTVLSRDMIGVAERPVSRVPRAALTSPAQVVGRVTARPIQAGDVLTEEIALVASAALGPAYVLPRDMRAVTVSADMVSGIAGFLKPGSRVDVLAAFTRAQESAARVVLQDIEVLAVGAETEPESPASNSASLRTASRSSVGGRGVPVTLAVTVPEAERLVLADIRGKIRLALRPAEGGDYTSTSGVTETQISGLRNPTAVRAAPSTARTAPAVVALPPGRPVSIPPIFSGPLPFRPAGMSQTAGAREQQRAEHQVVVVRGTRRETVTFETLPRGGNPAAPGRSRRDGEQTDVGKIPVVTPPGAGSGISKSGQ